MFLGLSPYKIKYSEETEKFRIILRSRRTQDHKKRTRTRGDMVPVILRQVVFQLCSMMTGLPLGEFYSPWPRKFLEGA